MVRPEKGLLASIEINKQHYIGCCMDFFLPSARTVSTGLFQQPSFSLCHCCFFQITHNSGWRAPPFSKTPLRAQRENPALPFINWNHHCVMQFILQLPIDREKKKSQLKWHFLGEHCTPQRKASNHLTGSFPVRGRSTSRNSLFRVRMQIIYFLELWKCPLLHQFSNNNKKQKQKQPVYYSAGSPAVLPWILSAVSLWIHWPFGWRAKTSR